MDWKFKLVWLIKIWKLKNKAKLEPLAMQLPMQLPNWKFNKKKSDRVFSLFLRFFDSVLTINTALIRFNLSLFNFNYFKFFKNINSTHWYFINANINTIDNNTKYLKKIRRYRRIFVSPTNNYYSKVYKNSCKMVIKYHYFKTFKIWFKSINRAEPGIINLNNLFIYSNEILNSIIYFFKKFGLYAFLKLNKFFKFVKNNHKKYKQQKLFILNCLYSLKKKNKQKILLKKVNLKIFFKLIKYLSNLIFLKNNKIYLQILLLNSIKLKYINISNFIKYKYIKKFLYLFKLYTNYSLKYKNYWNFSFILRLKRKKKKVKTNIFVNKQFNFIYILNNLINKYLYFIFLYWINLFFKIYETLKTINLFIKNKKLYLTSVYSLYYQKPQGRRFYRYLPKLRYLPYFKPCSFLLYLYNYN